MSLELKKTILRKNLQNYRIENDLPSSNDIDEIVNSKNVEFIYNSMDDYLDKTSNTDDSYRLKKDFIQELDKLNQYFHGRGLQREVLIINELKKKYNG